MLLSNRLVYVSDNTPPIFNYIRNITTSMPPDNPVLINAIIKDTGDINYSTIYYSVNGSYNTVPLKRLFKILYLVGGRSDYNIDARFTDWDITRINYNDPTATNILYNLSSYNLVIIDGITDPAQFGIGTLTSQSLLLNYTSNGGDVLVQVPNIDINIFNVTHVSGWINNNVLTINYTHPFTRTPYTGDVNNWPASETNGYWNNWHGYNLIFADISDPINNAVTIIKDYGLGHIVLDSSEISYPGNSPYSNWKMENMLYYFYNNNNNTKYNYVGYIPATHSNNSVSYYITSNDLAGNNQHQPYIRIVCSQILLHQYYQI